MKPSKYRSTSQNAAMAKIAPAALKKRLSRAARANGAGRKEVNHAFPSRPPAILTGRPAFGGAPPMDTEAFRKPPRPKNWSGVV
jgi:hypothetical protein